MFLVKAGDIDKMSLLFNRHARYLYGFLFHMTQSKELSEDIVQDVFYRLLKYRQSFRGDGPFVTWMFHVTRNELKRKQKKLLKAGLSYDLSQAAENANDDKPADESLVTKQNQQQLHSAMARMRYEDRELLTLSKLQGLKYAEIATILDVTEAAVKVRVHRAFNELKAIYRKSEENEMRKK